MKLKKMIPAVMLAICLAACADQTDENVRTDITAAVSSEAVSAEETTAEKTETTVITTAEAAPLYELEESRKADRTYAEISDDTPFFSCGYEQTGLVSAEDFADKALIESAKEAFFPPRSIPNFTMMSKAACPTESLRYISAVQR